MRLRGYLYIFVAAFFWGSSGTAAKFLFEHDISPLLVVETRVIFSAALLFVVLLIARPAMLKVSAKDLKDFFLLGVVGVAGANYTYYEAIRETSVGVAILMQYTAPVVVAGYMVASRKERISHVKTISIVLSLTGCAIMLGALSPSVHITRLGALLGLLSSISFAFFNVFNRVASKEYPIWSAIFYTLLSASLFWLATDLLFIHSLTISGPRELTTLVAFSCVSVLFPYFFYFTGLRFLLPSTAVIVSTLEPVVAILTAFMLLGERMQLTQIGGGLMIVSSVVLLEVKRE